MPTAAFFYLLWHAPRGLDVTALFAFSIAMLIGVRISLSLYEVPSNALAPELAPDYDQRTSLFAYRWFFMILAVSGMTFILYFVYLRTDASNPAGVMNRERYGAFAALGSAIMFLCILISSAATHSRIPYLHRPPARKITLADTVREIAFTFANPALISIVVATILGGAAYGMTTALSSYFYLDLWGLEPQAIGPLVSIGLLLAVPFVFVAPAISLRFGKKRSMLGLFSGSLVVGLAPISARMLGLMPPNGGKLLYGLLITDVMATYALSLIAYVVLSSMVADVAEDQAVRSGARSEGVLFAANGLVPKITTGIGAFLAGLVLNVVHFPTRAAPG